jgi:peptidoglycan/xylan/chitin deacetylase (PgdA/CDA1 family)
MQILADRHTVVSVEQAVELLRDGEPIPPRAVAVTIDDGYADAYTQAYPILRRLCLPATLFLPADLIGVKSADRPPNHLCQSEFLSWDQAREMGSNGIAFGSHTLNHVSLASVGRQEALRQLTVSKAKLEHALGRDVLGFSYPFGTFRDFSPVTEQLVSVAGYSWAVTAVTGVNRHGANLTSLKRTVIMSDDGVNEFHDILRGGLDPWFVMQWCGRFLRPVH